jgi:hypothetical protein
MAGCGEDGSEPDAQTRLEESLATVSASEPLGVGFGWIDVERLREGEEPLAGAMGWAAGALGPGARGLAENARAVARSGVDPLAADTLISTATSYTLALRLDGADPERAAAAFERAGGRARDAGEWTNFDLGRDWAIPDEPRLEALGSLAARPAVRPGAVLLARSTLARDAMERPEPPAIEAPEVAAAAGCLGDVVAARLVLNNHTHLPNSGPEVLAFGVSSADREREVLCLVGTGERVRRATEALEAAFGGGGTDGVSGEPLDDLVAGAEVEARDQGELAVRRVAVTRAPGTAPGFLFGAFDRGSLLTYLGLQPPPSPG